MLDRGPSDVIALQEIERGQARRLAAALGDASMRWAFKHFSWRTWPEGLAVLTPHRLTRATPFVLRRGTWFCVAPAGRHRRRDRARRREAVGVVDVHLSPHERASRGWARSRLVVARVGRGGARRRCIVGDFNDAPRRGPAPSGAAGRPAGSTPGR